MQTKNVTFETYSDKYYLDIVHIVKNFHEDSLKEFDGHFSPEALIETITQLKQTQADSCFLLIVDGKCEGLLAGVSCRSFFNGKPIFQELIWYINKEHRKYGLKLLQKVENELLSRGISSIIMAVMENSMTQRIKDLYVRLGYRPMETHYIRNL